MEETQPGVEVVDLRDRRTVVHEVAGVDQNVAGRQRQLAMVPGSVAHAHDAERSLSYSRWLAGSVLLGIAVRLLDSESEAEMRGLEAFGGVGMNSSSKAPNFEADASEMWH